jgi:uncharacterized coiled-coil protein SlyX
MAIPAGIIGKALEKRIMQLEERVHLLESEVNELKSILDSHYIE